MRLVKLSVFIALYLLGHSFVFAKEQDDTFSTYRLLSISESEKLILVSHITEKTKYLLDASYAKITMNGNPVEFDELSQFSNIQVKIKLERSRRLGITLDGIATEILIPKN